MAVDLPTSSEGPFRVQVSLIWKILFPFLLLALILGVGSIVVLNRLLDQEETERFLRVLADSGQQAVDSLSRQEVDLLEIERLIVNTEGVREAAFGEDAETLRSLVLPLVVNAGVDMVTIINQEGISLLTVRARESDQPEDYETLRGEGFYPNWPAVSRILQEPGAEEQGGKASGLEFLPLQQGDMGLFYVVGPLVTDDQQPVGAVIVGEYLTGIVQRMDREAGANITLYSPQSGETWATTLEPGNLDALRLSESMRDSALDPGVENPIRVLQIAGSDYWEIVTPYTLQQGEEIALLGVSLLRVELTGSSARSVTLVTRLGAVAMVVVLVVGVLIAFSITKPLRGLVEASTQIAMGNLDTQVLVEGSDEISALSSSLNRLLDDLRQGRLQSGGLSSASPATPLNQLPSTTFQQEEGTGPLRITVTILHANTQGWTPPELGGKGEGDLQRLKYLYESVVPILVAHGGLISHFGLDGVQAIFGLHPRYAPPHISALQGVHAALEIQTGIRIGGWSSRMEKPEGFISGIGVATGSVQVVAIGKEPNSYVTPVGLPLEVARELQQVSLDMEGNPVLIGPETYRHLGSSRKRFAFGRTGEARIPNVPEVLRIYEVESREKALIEGADLQKTLELFQIEEMETEGDLPA